MTMVSEAHQFSKMEKVVHNAIFEPLNFHTTWGKFFSTPPYIKTPWEKNFWMPPDNSDHKARHALAKKKLENSKEKLALI